MNMQREPLAGRKQRIAARAALALLTATGCFAAISPQDRPGTASGETRTTTAQSKFYCNIKALNSDERARHKQITGKLMAALKKVVEGEKGYEFQFSPANIPLAELAEWVAAESKCCPFLDFHIDLEDEGSLLCLRLTGADGIKQFIRAEFRVGEK